MGDEIYFEYARILNNCGSNSQEYLRFLRSSWYEIAGFEYF